MSNLFMRHTTTTLRKKWKRIKINSLGRPSKRCGLNEFQRSIESAFALWDLRSYIHGIYNLFPGRSLFTVLCFFLMCSGQQYGNVSVLQVHRESWCSEASDEGARFEEDSSGHRGLSDLQGEGQETSGWTCRSYIQLRSKTVHTHVLGEGGSKESSRRLSMCEVEIGDEFGWSNCRSGTGCRWKSDKCDSPSTRNRASTDAGTDAPRRCGSRGRGRRSVSRSGSPAIAARRDNMNALEILADRDNYLSNHHHCRYESSSQSYDSRLWYHVPGKTSSDVSSWHYPTAMRNVKLETILNCQTLAQCDSQRKWAKIALDYTLRLTTEWTMTRDASSVLASSRDKEWETISNHGASIRFCT